MQKKTGISLIVLVITIIVMIILAAAIILSLNNAGIIGNANKAVDGSNMANVKAAADLVYADYLITGVKGKTEESLGEEITQKLIDNNTIKGNDYYIKVYEGETYVIKEGSLADKYYDKTLKIGDYVGYNAGVEEVALNEYLGKDYSNNGELKQVIVKANNEIKWKVLGIEGDKVKLVSEDVVNPEGKDGFNLYGAYSYLKGEEMLNTACSAFGKGEHANSARSINVTDIDKITNYNKYDYKLSVFQGLSYKVIAELPYGTKLKYDGISKFPSKYEMLNLICPILKVPDINSENFLKEKVSEITMNNYYYYAKDPMGETASTSNPGNFSVEYKTLFVNSANEYMEYWLSDSTTGQYTHDSVEFSMRHVYGGRMNGACISYQLLYHAGLWGDVWDDDALYSTDYETGNAFSLRPIVLLESNVMGNYDETNKIWNLK